MSIDFSLFTSLRHDAQLKQVASLHVPSTEWNARNESPLYMLDYHRDRLLRAATYWKWEKAVQKLSGQEGLQNLVNVVQDTAGPAEPGPFRVRIVVTRRGEMMAQRFDAPSQHISNLFPSSLARPTAQPGTDEPKASPRVAVLVDSHGSDRSAHTHFKTTNRAVYDEARARAGIGPVNPADTTEVLIFNRENDCIMEGSTTTPYFWQDGQWTTPPVSPHFARHDGSGGNDGTTRRWALERGLAVEREIKIHQLIDGDECYISNGVSGFRAGVIRLRNP